MSATPRGLVFGTIAESHERFRLGYPDEVVDRTLAYAGRDVTRAVEVGAGTGKATRAFASRGIAVTALEPDPDMFTVLQRETLGMQVEPVAVRFEEYDGPRTDLVYAAAAWHGTEPHTRWNQAAGLLVEGGVVALFNRPVRIADPAVEVSVAAACRTALRDDASGPPGGGLAACGLFTDIEDHLLAREVLVSDREYIGYLSTLPAYLDLPLDERQDLLRRITDVVPAQVRLDLTVSLLLARRV